jgi:hypothetical protein
MFCPNCGTEERQRSQFCRVCGTDLRVVRTGLERPDSITASAITAREEIGKAIAARIREVETSKDLHRIAEHVLPQITDFLASPDELRLKRIRQGMITAAVGVASIIFFMVLAEALHKHELEAVATLGLIPSFVGLVIVINGIFFSMSRKKAVPDGDPSLELPPADESVPREMNTAAPTPLSVTEHTTKHLQQS